MSLGSTDSIAPVVPVSVAALLSAVVAISTTHLTVADEFTAGSPQLTIVPSVIRDFHAFPVCGGSAPVMATVKSIYDSFAT